VVAGALDAAAIRSRARSRSHPLEALKGPLPDGDIALAG
jgi:hypothetical protein